MHRITIDNNINWYVVLNTKLSTRDGSWEALQQKQDTVWVYFVTEIKMDFSFFEIIDSMTEIELSQFLQYSMVTAQFHILVFPSMKTNARMKKYQYWSKQTTCYKIYFFALSFSDFQKKEGQEQNKNAW